MLNPHFDPLSILENHERTVNDIINSHNELAKLTESLAATLVQQNNRIEALEGELSRIYDYIGKNIK